MSNTVSLEHNGKRYENWTPTALKKLGVPVDTVDQAALDAMKASALRKIETAAASARGRCLTTTAGQSDVYAQKLQEAKAYQSAGASATRPASDYPVLSAEASATCQTLAALVSSVLAANGNWVAVAAKIEGARAGAKVAVTAAKTSADVTAAAAAAIIAFANI